MLVIGYLFGCSKTNWHENYDEKEKSPFGNYIIYKEAENLFKDEKIIVLNKNIENYLNNISEKNQPSTYVLIKNNSYKISEDGFTALLKYAEEGNSVFLSLNSFPEFLKEKLDFKFESKDYMAYDISALKKLKGDFYIGNKQTSEKQYQFDRNIRRNYFSEINKNNTTVLGTAKKEEEKVPNFIKIQYGKGTFFLHANPIVFTNYYLLKDTKKYAENITSYLPSQTILWDPMLKYSRVQKEDNENNDSVFKFFLQHKTLTWFLYVSLAGILLFMIFNARRKQRAIPIITPLKNTTVAFTQTIASLYLKEDDHKNLVDKKITFFLEKIRTKYLINTNNLDTHFIQKLALKSGNNLQKTKYLIHSIIALNKKENCTEEDILVLHKMIENFFKK